MPTDTMTIQTTRTKSVVVVLLLLVTAARVNEFFYVRCPPHILPSTPLLFHLVPGRFRKWQNQELV